MGNNTSGVLKRKKDVQDDAKQDGIWEDHSCVEALLHYMELNSGPVNSNNGPEKEEKKGRKTRAYTHTGSTPHFYSVKLSNELKPYLEALSTLLLKFANEENETKLNERELLYKCVCVLACISSEDKAVDMMLEQNTNKPIFKLLKGELVNSHALLKLFFTLGNIFQRVLDTTPPRRRSGPEFKRHLQRIIPPEHLDLLLEHLEEHVRVYSTTLKKMKLFRHGSSKNHSSSTSSLEVRSELRQRRLFELTGASIEDLPQNYFLSKSAQHSTHANGKEVEEGEEENEENLKKKTKRKKKKVLKATSSTKISIGKKKKEKSKEKESGELDETEDLLDSTNSPVICIEKSYNEGAETVIRWLITEGLRVLALVSELHGGVLTKTAKTEQRILALCIRLINIRSLQPIIFRCLASFRYNDPLCAVLIKEESLMFGTMELIKQNEPEVEMQYPLTCIIYFLKSENGKYMEDALQSNILEILFNIVEQDCAPPVRLRALEAIGHILQRSPEHKELILKRPNMFQLLIKAAGEGEVILHHVTDIQSLSLQPEHIFANGADGDVYRSTWNEMEVAVKLFKHQDQTPEELLYFRREISIMSVLQHPNLVTVIGASTESPYFGFITPYYHDGNLHALIHGDKEHKPVSLDFKQKVKLAIGFAEGMEYLHSFNVIHRDLKPANVLVSKTSDGEKSLSVCDFGLARVVEQSMTKATIGTPAYIAPEIYTDRKYGFASDVFAFAIILWEMLYEQTPFDGCTSWHLSSAVLRGERPQTTSDVTPEAINDLLSECWAPDPSLRLSFTQIVQRLRQIVELQ
ncbi:copper transport protein ctr1 [Balamuthia mandrillaris]